MGSKFEHVANQSKHSAYPGENFRSEPRLWPARHAGKRRVGLLSSLMSATASRRCFKMEHLRSHTTRIARKDKRPGSQEVTVSPLKRIKHSESPACTQPAPPFASSPVRLLKARRMSHHKMTQPSSVGTTPGEEALRTSPSLSLSPRSTRKTVSRLRSDGTLCGHVNISIFTHVQSEVSETT